MRGGGWEHRSNRDYWLLPIVATTIKITVVVAGSHSHSRPQLHDCSQTGLWF
jgi:hypothetical protein